MGHMQMFSPSFRKDLKSMKVKHKVNDGGWRMFNDEFKYHSSIGEK